MARVNDSAELDMFMKTDPRPRILPALGWTPCGKVKDRFTRGSESIGVFQGNKGVWLARSGSDYRNIVQLTQEVVGSLGQARKFLREIIGSGAPATPVTNTTPTPPAHFPSPHPHLSSPVITPSSPAAEPEGEAEEKRTADEIKAEIKAESVPFDDSPIPPYLLKRGFVSIPDIFRRRMRIDKDGNRFKNVSFLYYLPTEDGKAELVSRERKGDKYSNYLSRTRAGVWIAEPIDGEVDHIVICEAPLDCISSRAICGDGERTAYFALRSGAEAACVEIVRRVVEKRGKGARIELRTDNDPAGLSYAAKVAAGLKKLGLVARYTAPPDLCEDWTEVQEKRFAESQK